MFTSRALQTSARRLAAQRTSIAVSKFAPPVAVATNTHYLQSRPNTSSVEQYKPENARADSLIAKQRRNRPVSPHLSIYRPQITWIPSMFNRLTGIILSGGLYVFGLGYLVAPALGIHMESAVLAASFAAWPLAAKVATKFLIALPFTFHSFNGIRHLIWDFGKQITNKQVQVTGWTVVGLTFASAGYLAAFV
ncbi:hypothetical protein EJ08DRAFT_623642 [Tothia fuscella]|uniref:Succinate dehydrogenase subunit C n=1 Tax=Tothia fuscella TaxID=1048955 RepID=A0A9P4P4J8_9PEZI|nr:hypothetical protein EJ08DRAFT_623642 [Tothia fuscella]